MMTKKSITVNNRSIGPDYPPFIIAELSGNHNGSLERAKSIVKAAADAGADAIKLQTYTADTMTIKSSKPGFTIDDPKSLWYGRTLYDLYEEAYTPWEWHQPLFDYAQELGLIFFSTPFDDSAVDFLTSLHVPLFKIASFENTDLPLIRRVAATGKPLIISAGTATLAEMEKAIAAARDTGLNDIIVLKCTSAYPAPYGEANLRTIPRLAEKLNVPTGLSDHTMGIAASVAAVALGACVIEKHFTLSRADGGVDSAFSLEPHEMADLVQSARNAWEALGNADYAPTASEKASLEYRRSLYVTQQVRKGDAFTRQNVRAIRPGFGLPPDELDKIINGGYAKSDLDSGTPMAHEYIEWKTP